MEEKDITQKEFLDSLDKKIEEIENSEKKEKKKEDKMVKKLTEEIEVLKNELLISQDKLLRNSAELANFKRRKDLEVSNMLKYANEDFIIELLPVIDNFERAIKLDDNDLSDEVSKFLSGFKMIFGGAHKGSSPLNKFTINNK